MLSCLSPTAGRGDFVSVYFTCAGLVRLAKVESDGNPVLRALEGYGTVIEIRGEQHHHAFRRRHGSNLSLVGAAVEVGRTPKLDPA
jgi:hypothetical protein